MDCGGFGVVYWKCSGSGCSWLFIRPEVAASWQPFMESNISQSSHHFKPLFSSSTTSVCSIGKVVEVGFLAGQMVVVGFWWWLQSYSCLLRRRLCCLS